MPVGKFPGGGVTSPTSAYSSSGYPGFQPPFPNKNNNEMVKSTIHDNNKPPEPNFGYPMQPPEKPAFMANTPTRRAPRMSEPMQFDSSLPTKPFEYKPPQNDPTGDSPGIQKRFRDPKDFENQFFKNRQGSATTIDEKETKEQSGKF
jgi:hypothetical protein